MRITIPTTPNAHATDGAIGPPGPEAFVNPAIPWGALAEGDGKSDKRTVVRRNLFTEVTGP